MVDIDFLNLHLRLLWQQVVLHFLLLFGLLLRLFSVCIITFSLVSRGLTWRIELELLLSIAAPMPKHYAVAAESLKVSSQNYFSFELTAIDSWTLDHALDERYRTTMHREYEVQFVVFTFIAPDRHASFRI